MNISRVAYQPQQQSSINFNGKIPKIVKDIGEEVIKSPSTYFSYEMVKNGHPELALLFRVATDSIVSQLKTLFRIGKNENQTGKLSDYYHMSRFNTTDWLVKGVHKMIKRFNA